MSPPYRVAITGIGAITPVGSERAGLWDGILRGRSAVGPVTRFDASPFRSRLAAEIRDFDPSPYLDARQRQRLDRFAQLAVASSVQAVDDAGLDLDRRPALRHAMGCYVGSALGGIAFAEEQHDRYLRGGICAVSPTLALTVFGGAAPTNVAIHLGLRGPTQCNSNSCASGAVAIGDAFRLVRDGLAPAMLAGGVEAPLVPLTFGSFAIIKAMSTSNRDPSSASRPLDAARDGFVMGEGAAMLVLERLADARARGAHVYAEIRGYGSTNDAYHMLAPLPDGSAAAEAICAALSDAGVAPDEVEYVNAHASSTPLGDRAEAAALGRALGGRTRRVPVSATKGLYGHPLGASGAIETAITALALDTGFLPGTANFTTPDPEIPLDVVPPGGRAASARIALKNAFGFGGINAALVLARAEEASSPRPPAPPDGTAGVRRYP